MKLQCMLGLMAASLLACQPKPEGAPTSGSTHPEVPVSGERPLNVGSPETLVGHRLEAVEAACDAAKISHRVIERDGEPLPATKDYRVDRLNFSVRNGVITAVTTG